MDREQIVERLVRIVRPYIAVVPANGPVILTGNEHLVKDLRVDSVDVIEIIIDIEAAFNIRIEDQEIRNLITVNDLADLIQIKTK